MCTYIYMYISSLVAPPRIPRHPTHLDYHRTPTELSTLLYTASFYLSYFGFPIQSGEETVFKLAKTL